MPYCMEEQRQRPAWQGNSILQVLLPHMTNPLGLINVTQQSSQSIKGLV